MRKSVKLIVLVLIMALGLGGIVGFAQWHAHKKLQNKITEFETRVVEIAEVLEVELEEMDTIAIEQQRAKIEELRVDVQKEMNKHDDEKKLMFYELDMILSYMIEAVDIVVGIIDNPWNLLTGVPEERMNNIMVEVDAHYRLYNQYKQQLRIETVEGFQEELEVNEL